MTKIIIVYGSSTGNTGKLVAYLAETLNGRGFDVTVKAAAAVNIDSLADYDIILLGSSTWGTGSLQESMKQFYFKMDTIDLAGKQAAAFGPGDLKSYPRSFCKAVDALERKLTARGAKVILPGLKIDGEPDSSKNMDAAAVWVDKLVSGFAQGEVV